MKKLVVLFLLFSLTSLGLSQPAYGQKSLNFSDIASGKFRPKGITALRSMADGQHFTAISDSAYAIVRYRYVDGVAVDTIFNAKSVRPTFKIRSYELSADEKLILLPDQIEGIFRHSRAAYNWIFDRTTGRMSPLSAAGKQQAATFSPDGRMVAFVRGRNIYVTDLATAAEKQVTADGEAGAIINGVTDWVYEEEFGYERAFEWCPSSDAIAYYRFDETKVKSYPMPTFNGKLYPDNVTFKYPKAGQDNSIVQIRVYNISSGRHTPINVGDNSDQYIPAIEWTGRSGELAVHRLNRLQNNYELLLCNAITGFATPVYSESSPRYIERIDKSKVNFLPEVGRMIIKSEVGGTMQLYLYEMQGKFVRKLSAAAGEVTEINAIDARSGKIYFTATDSPLRRALYVTSIKRAEKTRRLISCDFPGYYIANFSVGAKYYIQNFTTAHTPNIYTVHSAEGKRLRVLQDNAALSDTLATYAMPVKEFFTFTTPQGVELNGYMLKPVDFDASKKYPILMTQYSGPGSQSVDDRFKIGWEEALIADGYLVACVDGRGTGFRGFDFKSCTYGNLGALEVEDQISAAKYLSSLAYIDPARIGIYGWSYGGFMALNCILKGADVFSTAVAVAPVTSWRYYDTIYTEIYNGLPQDNPAGYDDNSPINHAEKLVGNLLIAHGTADDNVHIQNSYDMFSALNAADKQYEMIIYPDRNHSMYSNTGSDYNRLIGQLIDFINRKL